MEQGILHLLHPQGHLAVGVSMSDVQLRMSALHKPLIEKPHQVLASSFFESSAQLRDFDGGLLVLKKVMVEGGEEGFIANILSKHVEHPSTLVVGVAVEHIFPVDIAVADERLALGLGFFEVVVDFGLLHQTGLIGAILVLGPEVFGIISERLV